eukprot:TRINITY_DN89106_c0_g1_i1.p1 TRINITY_DN89106_c0_g1~~TRINITY_DN89106_c0_g1_i1.p1  ORF type:complete len:483 (-),score=48.38 TRINITY_DN89106_c0_g1_i1:125-1573(-)
MPRELICVQVGQTGNQLGGRFWDLALQEHKQYSNNIFDDCMSSFFRNVDQRTGCDIPGQPGGTPISHLRARAVPVDMEEGPLSSLLKGPLGFLFDNTETVSDYYGCGNNWGVGFHQYGQKYADRILESLRRESEHCDSLQTFLMLHSLGGGTGSGLGTKILTLLEDEFPNVYRFSSVVVPSADDDVITSPYNAVLATHQLINHADCVLPVDNQSLIEISNRAQRSADRSAATAVVGSVSSVADTNKHKYGKKEAKGGKAYDAMNSIVAHMLTNLTASMRFPGVLNIDLNEITTNLVPYPKLHFLIPAVTPLTTTKHTEAHAMRRVDQMFMDGIHKDFQLVTCDPYRSKYLAMACMLRGKEITVADVQRNVKRLQEKITMPYWNPEGFKTGLCSCPPIGQPYSMLCLSNNCCMEQMLDTMSERCLMLYKPRAHLYHYTDAGVSEADIDDALENIACSVDDYRIMAEQCPTASAQELLDKYAPL